MHIDYRMMLPSSGFEMGKCNSKKCIEWEIQTFDFDYIVENIYFKLSYIFLLRDKWNHNGIRYKRSY